MVQLDARGKPVKPPPAGKYRQATPHEKGAAVEMYFDGLSYRRTAGNMDQFFGRPTNQMSVYSWVRDLSKKADPVLRPMKVDAGTIRVADEVVVKVGGQNYWLFNMMDSKCRFLLASYRDAIPRAFPTHKVNPMVSQGVKAEINNNLSERLQGTIRDRDKTLRGLKSRATGQTYVDGLVTHFRPHESLKGKKPAESAGAEIPYDSWEDVAAMKSGE